MLFQVIVIIFAIAVLLIIYNRYRRKEINLKEFLFWILFWSAVAVVTLLLRKTDFLAQYLGVQRSADLVVYLSIIIIFYTVFRIYVRIDRIEKNITKIVTEISINDKERKK